MSKGYWSVRIVSMSFAVLMRDDQMPHRSLVLGTLGEHFDGLGNMLN